MSPRRLFVLDASGACLSVVLLGFVLPACHSYLGIPPGVFRPLLLWAIVCLLYDLTCLRWMELSMRRWVVGIISLNSCYGILAGVVAVHHWSVLTQLGVVFFIGDVCVIFALVVLESWVLRCLGDEPVDPPPGRAEAS